MKITFETTEDREAKLFLHANDMLLALWDYSEWLRNQVKHEGMDETAKDRFWEVMEERGIASLVNEG